MGTQPGGDIVHRTLDTGRSEPVVQIAEIVAELENKNEDELTTTYEKLDHVLSHIFENPPEPEAQVEISFSYEGYRVTVEQNGDAQFVRTAD